MIKSLGRIVQKAKSSEVSTAIGKVSTKCLESVERSSPVRPFDDKKKDKFDMHKYSL